MGLKLHGDYLERYGMQAWCFRAACGVASRTIGFRALRGMTLDPEDVDPRYLDLPERFTHHRCTAEEFADRDAVVGTDMEAFCAQAAQRGDWCHYIADGDTVASYGWYAQKPVPALDETWIRFSPKYVYMYKGFTIPEYRGLQLHGYGMAHAAAAAVDSGYEGLISFVEVQNEGSLRSVTRLGYRIFGTCTQIRMSGKTLTHRTPGCRAYEFELFVPGEGEGRPWGTGSAKPEAPTSGPMSVGPPS